MTIEEKIQLIKDLMQVDGNIRKLLYALVSKTLPSLPEDKLDELLTVLQS